MIACYFRTTRLARSLVNMTLVPGGACFPGVFWPEDISVGTIMST